MTTDTLLAKVAHTKVTRVSKDYIARPTSLDGDRGSPQVKFLLCMI